MAKPGNIRAVRGTPEITFSIEARPANIEQIEAGKRLFKRLVARAQLKGRE